MLTHNRHPAYLYSALSSTSAFMPYTAFRLKSASPQPPLPMGPRPWQPSARHPPPCPPSLPASAPGLQPSLMAPPLGQLPPLLGGKQGAVICFTRWMGAAYVGTLYLANPCRGCSWEISRGGSRGGRWGEKSAATVSPPGPAVSGASTLTPMSPCVMPATSTCKPMADYGPATISRLPSHTPPAVQPSRSNMPVGTLSPLPLLILPAAAMC